MQCITSVSYYFNVNGSARGSVKPGRGIRQGDPLSLYVFLLCSELLSGLCKIGHETGALKGIKIATGCPNINHLLFADDTMFFCKANGKNVRVLKKILATYESVSGQLINAHKSSISFSRKTSQTTREDIKQTHGIEKE